MFNSLDDWDKERFSKELEEACGDRTSPKEIAEDIMNNPSEFTPREIRLASSYLWTLGGYNLVESLLNYYKDRFGEPSEWQ